MMPRRQKRKNPQAGAALIVIIASMTVVAVLGAGMLGLFSTSIFSELFINNREKAYYLAQAGRQYATAVINAANISGDPTPIANLNNQTFTLSDGGQFYLRTDTTDVKYTAVESTGIVNANTAFETKQKIGFRIASIKFSKGVYAVGSIAVNKNAFVDSYDSRLGPYSFATHTQNATVQTNGTAASSIFVQAAGKIFGNAVCGYGGDPAVAIFGAAGTITGTRTASTANVTFTAVDPPTGCSDFRTCGTQIPDITANTALAAGTYGTKNVDLNSETLTINGDVKLIVHDTLTYDRKGNPVYSDGNLNMINASKILISSGGSLELYVIRTFTIGGTSVINPPPSPATAVRILGVTTTEFNFSKASTTYAGIYGPGATFTLDSTSQVFGSVVAKTVSISGSTAIGTGTTGSIHVDTGFALNEGVVY